MCPANLRNNYKNSKLWELFTVAFEGSENVCVLDAGRANQSIQQLSSTLEQPHHSEGREEEQGKGPRGSLGSLFTPMDGDKTAWNQKAQSEAGISVKIHTCQRVHRELEMY